MSKDELTDIVSSNKLRDKIDLHLQSISNPIEHYDSIVIGVGSMGSATCYHLAKSGHKVLGLEQFGIAHEHGSHSGQTRIIRKAYFEYPDYVPLLERAYENWSALEEETGISLFRKTGMLYLGKPDDRLIKGVRNSAQKFNLNIQNLSSETLKKEYPQFLIPEGHEGVFEPDAGFLLPETAILSFTERALNFGAHIRIGEKTLKWEHKDGHIEVVTNKDTYNCSKLIITAGAWANKMIQNFRSSFKVTKQTLAWVKPKDEALFELGDFPTWIFDNGNNQGSFYGFPKLSEEKFNGPVGLKVAHHHPGPEIDPDEDQRGIPENEETKIIEFLNRHLPEGYSEINSISTCLYTYSKDENFILGPSPESDNVFLATGFSGHGFKFASVIGEILADLAISGSSSLPIEFLSPARF